MFICEVEKINITHLSLFVFRILRFISVALDFAFGNMRI